FYKQAVGYIDQADSRIHANDFNFEKEKNAVKGNILGFKLMYRGASLESERHEYALIAEKLKKELKKEFDRLLPLKSNFNNHQLIEMEFAEELLKTNFYETIDYVECIEQLKSFYP
ncbi:MAG: hypothetical protein HWN80_20670, partial [Candidatus Lokiarchaeota archaeon]|nr:hypothetical protein [Candidatus Lokiarchaeota archaeon]